MAEFSAPFSTSQIATEFEWSMMARRWGLDGVHANTAGSSNLKVTGSGAATVSIAAGRAYVNGFFYRNDAAKVLNVPANAGGTPRVDLVVLRSDQTNNQVTAEYKTGGTIAPDLTQDEEDVWEIPLAQCTVAAGSSVVTAAAVVDKRWFTAKGIAPSIAGARRPSVEGLVIVEGNDMYLGDGSGWNWISTAGSQSLSSYTPVWSAGGSSINWGSGSQNIGRYKLLGGGLCYLKIQLIPTGNPGPNSNPLEVTLPTPAHAATRQQFLAHLESLNGESIRNGVATTLPSLSTSRIGRIRINESGGTAGNMETNEPINMRNGDVLTISGTYEIA